jgi:hypothetical protein
MYLEEILNIKYEKQRRVYKKRAGVYSSTGCAPEASG